MRSWSLWLLALAPAAGVAVASLGGRPAWARALGLALAAGLLAGAALLWRNGLQVDLRGAARAAPAAVGPGAYGVALAWVGLYALAAGAACTWLVRAVLRRAA